MGWLDMTEDEDSVWAGSGYVPTPDQKKAEEVRQECLRCAREYEARLRMALEKLEMREFRVELLVAVQAERLEDENLKEREEWAEWARRRHPEWGRNPRTPARLRPKFRRITPAMTGYAVRVTDVRTGASAHKPVRRNGSACSSGSSFDCGFLLGRELYRADAPSWKVVKSATATRSEHWCGMGYDWSTFGKSSPYDLAGELAGETERKLADKDRLSKWELERLTNNGGNP